LGYEVQVPFTFYGLQLPNKNLKLPVSPLDNLGMTMGIDKWFPVMGTALPGMQTVMTYDEE
jgi:peroxiredoxin family protein